MENNDVFYYASRVHVIAQAINFLVYIQKRLDRKLGFHHGFVDEHIHVLDEIKSYVKYLFHVH